MKVIWTRRLFGKGAFAPTPEWKAIRDGVVSAIEEVVWPAGSSNFTINPSRKGNGVSSITTLVAQRLKARSWDIEQSWPIPQLSQPGKMDGAYPTDHGLVAFEWETGNVASSHRSINKMCLGLTIGSIAAGLLALPSRSFARFLTDRVGNVEEIEPYFRLWEATPCESGILEILVVEHDELSSDVLLIPKIKSGLGT